MEMERWRAGVQPVKNLKSPFLFALSKRSSKKSLCVKKGDSAPCALPGYATRKGCYRLSFNRLKTKQEFYISSCLANCRYAFGSRLHSEYKNLGSIPSNAFHFAFKLTQTNKQRKETQTASNSFENELRKNRLFVRKQQQKLANKILVTFLCIAVATVTAFLKFGEIAQFAVLLSASTSPRDGSSKQGEKHR